MRRYLYFLLMPLFLASASCGLFGGGGSSSSSSSSSSSNNSSTSTGDTAVVQLSGDTALSLTEATDVTAPIFTQAYDPFICAEVISANQTVIRFSDNYQGTDIGGFSDWGTSVQINLIGNTTGTYTGSSQASVFINQLASDGTWGTELYSDCTGGSPAVSVTVTKVGNVNDTIEGTWTATVYNSNNFDGSGSCAGTAKQFVNGTFKATRVSDGSCKLPTIN